MCARGGVSGCARGASVVRHLPRHLPGRTRTLVARARANARAPRAAPWAQPPGHSPRGSGRAACRRAAGGSELVRETHGAVPSQRAGELHRGAASNQLRHCRLHARRAARLARDAREDVGVWLDADSRPAELLLKVPSVRVGDAVVAAEVDERAVPGYPQRRRASATVGRHQGAPAAVPRHPSDGALLSGLEASLEPAVGHLEQWVAARGTLPAGPPLASEDLLVDPLVLPFLAAVALLRRVRDGNAGRRRTVNRFVSPLECSREATQSGGTAGRITVHATG